MMKKIKESYKAILPGLLILVAIAALIVVKQGQKKTDTVLSDGVYKKVKIEKLDNFSKAATLSFEGTVKPVTKVDVLAMANGTVKMANFKIGDRVLVNQPLVFLADDMLATNYSNSSLNYSNIAQNVSLTKTLTDENIRQAGMGIERSKEVLGQAKISLDSARLSLENATSLQAKSKEDMLANALVAYNNYLNTANMALDQANFIIKAEGSSQLDGISATLSVKNSQVLYLARDKYITTKSLYAQLAQKNFSSTEAIESLKQVVVLLGQTKSVIDLSVSVLDNTISSSQFSESSLNMQRTSFVTIRANVVSALSTAQANLQSLQNIDLINKRETDGLKSAVRSAENQYKQAQIGVDNASLTLNNSKQSQSQQLLLSKSSLDNARGQLNLVGAQLADLTIKAPIAGEITNKMIETGAEVRVGQKIAEVSQTNMIKIVLSLSPEDAKLFKIGQEAKIKDSLVGTVSNINPSADSVNKKVTVEVVAENKLKLVPETLVTVSLKAQADALKMTQFKVPVESVVVAQNESYIFVTEGNIVKKSVVKVADVSGDWIFIEAALSGNATFVVEGAKNLSDGDQIKFN